MKDRLEFDTFKLLRKSLSELSPGEVCCDPLKTSLHHQDLRTTECRNEHRKREVSFKD